MWTHSIEADSAECIRFFSQTSVAAEFVAAVMGITLIDRLEHQYGSLTAPLGSRRWRATWL